MTTKQRVHKSLMLELLSLYKQYKQACMLLRTANTMKSRNLKKVAFGSINTLRAQFLNLVLLERCFRLN